MKKYLIPTICLFLFLGGMVSWNAGPLQEKPETIINADIIQTRYGIIRLVADLSAGIQGPPGPQGPQGDAGLSGNPGAKGDKGDTGNTGSQGIPGLPGADSTVPGPKGDKGDTGNQGTQGIQGPPGADSTVPGPQGNQGIQGIQGIQGNQGAKGDAGSPGTSGFDVSYYRKTGTTTYEAWYTSPRSGTALTGTALVAGRIYAVPFICPKAITIDQIGIYVSTLSTTTARLGIYSDGGNCYPGNLLLDAGTVDVTSTGAKKIAINQALSANSLYWLAIDCAATPAIYCIPVAGVVNVLGTSNALGTAQNAGFYAAQAYGTLPATFPATPTMITAAPIPAIFVRLLN